VRALRALGQNGAAATAWQITGKFAAEVKAALDSIAPLRYKPSRKGETGQGILARMSRPRLGCGTSMSARQTIKGENSVKKSILILTGVAVLAVGAYFGTGLFAQGTGGVATPPAAAQGTKIAVVNIGQVFNQYKRAQAFKADLESQLKPYKDRAKALTDPLKSWEDEMRKPGAEPKTVEYYHNKIKTNKRELEDMSADISKVLGKKQEDNLVTLWKEVNMGIEAVAKAYGFQIVLGYGDPIEKDLMHHFPNVNRKMQAMDAGSGVPLYIHSSVDLSDVIVNTLNKWIEPKGAVTPTSGTK
jgi:Skp family chaperone for outer membrane proteins